MVSIVTSPTYDNACSEVWVDPTTLSTTDPDVAERAALDATWALWSLTGERFHGDQCWVDDYRTIRGFCNIQTKHFPVAEIAYVTRVDMCEGTVAATGLGTAIDSWCYLGNNELRICCNGSTGHDFGIPSYFAYPQGITYGCSCSTGGNVVRVHYKVRNNLPPGASTAAFRLAEEYVKASQGQPCSLPERVTSVNRQGVSWTILDPQDFLEDGLTGIGPVDQWLAQVGLRSRWTTLSDPLRSVPLIASTLVGCEDQDCFASLSP